MTTYAYSSDAPGEIRTGLLIVPVFQGPAPGPGVREMGLADAYAGACEYAGGALEYGGGALEYAGGGNRLGAPISVRSPVKATGRSAASRAW